MYVPGSESVIGSKPRVQPGYLSCSVSRKSKTRKEQRCFLNCSRAARARAVSASSRRGSPGRSKADVSARGERQISNGLRLRIDDIKRRATLGNGKGSLVTLNKAAPAAAFSPSKAIK